MSDLFADCGLNMTHAAVDRHVEKGGGDRVAMRWPAAVGQCREVTYAGLREESSRFAGVLAGLGIKPGEVVAAYIGRIPALYVTALGAWRARCVFCPLFSDFGPEPVLHRLRISRAAVLVTTGALYGATVAGLRDRLPCLRHVLLADPDTAPPANTLSLPHLMRAAPAFFPIDPTEPQDRASLHFTSGTTGMPKGAVHVHDAVRYLERTGREVFQFQERDIFWCTADPGWVTGTSYGIITPLVCGVTAVVDEAAFDVTRWYSILAHERVSVWYTSPSAIRRLMRADPSPRDAYDLGALRLICSVGEPLHAGAVHWAEHTLGLPVVDTWWQTETGGIMISSAAAPRIRPGSMGWPLPGIEAAVVERSQDGMVVGPVAPEQAGELALKPGWPSLFREYLDAPQAYAQCFAGGWYLTGDLVRRDPDGYFWFLGRADDIIKSAGHLVSPFEVESALMDHAAVGEAAVIGIPDPLLGARVKAFVTLKPGRNAGEPLRRELIAYARRRLGPAIAPREIEFADELPKNKAGKIVRRLLRG
ncbi:MAG: AMP-binding protein [Desulfobacterales bacterium]